MNWDRFEYKNNFLIDVRETKDGQWKYSVYKINKNGDKNTPLIDTVIVSDRVVRKKDWARGKAKEEVDKYISKNAKNEMKSLSHIKEISTNPIELGKEFYNKHKKYIDKLRKETSVITKPSKEDLSNPALWKASHWNWFFSMKEESMKLSLVNILNEFGRAKALKDCPYIVRYFSHKFPGHDKEYLDCWVKAEDKFGGNMWESGFNWGGATNVFKIYCKRYELGVDDKNPEYPYVVRYLVDKYGHEEKYRDCWDRAEQKMGGSSLDKDFNWGAATQIFKAYVKRENIPFD